MAYLHANFNRLRIQMLKIPVVLSEIYSAVLLPKCL